MAINPNTNFTAGQVLTFDQQNRFPRGVMSFQQKTTDTGPFTAETIIVTLPSFTAVANRYYRALGFFPSCYTTGLGNSGVLTARIRSGTTTGGTLLNSAIRFITTDGSDDPFVIVMWVGTLTAGAQQMVLSAQSSANLVVTGAATAPVQFVLEDLGPA